MTPSWIKPLASLGRAPLPPRRGWALLDVIGGLILLTLVAIVLTSVLHRTSKARDRLADERAAARSLEQALVDLSLARPIDPAITVTPLSTPHFVQLSTNLSPNGPPHPFTLIGYVAPAKTEPPK